MSKSNFRLPSGGFLPPLSGQAKNELVKRFPPALVETLENEAGFYAVDRDGFESEPKPSEMREELLELAAQMKAVQEALQNLDWRYKSLIRPVVAEIAAVLPDMNIDTEGDRFLNDTAAACQVGAEAVTRAAKRIPLGHREPPVDRLMKAIWVALHEAGYEINAKPTGDLVQTFQIITEGLGENHSDARKMAERVLKAWKTRPKTDPSFPESLDDSA